MGLLTFDWAQINVLANPMVAPWWTTANVAVGFVFSVWFLAPLLYYTNVSSHRSIIRSRRMTDSLAGLVLRPSPDLRAPAI